MSDEELIQVLKEFETVRVEKLNENARRLFYAIMKIANERDELKQENQRLNNIIKFLKKYFKEHECYEEILLLEQLESEPYDEKWNGWKEL